MRILIFDNYDSFTYNLVHLVEKITGKSPDVFLNDQVALDKIKHYDKIILSPGPGVPSQAGLMLQVIKEYAAAKSILGVCLGHQGICEAFGGSLINLSEVYHGVATSCKIIARQNYLFKGLPAEIPVGRYHSWVADESSFPKCLSVTARDENNYIMALQHNTYDVTGVQFHPESILTPDGESILRNWLQR